MQLRRMHSETGIIQCLKETSLCPPLARVFRPGFPICFPFVQLETNVRDDQVWNRRSGAVFPPVSRRALTAAVLRPAG